MLKISKYRDDSFPNALLLFPFRVTSSNVQVRFCDGYDLLEQLKITVLPFTTNHVPFVRDVAGFTFTTMFFGPSEKIKT